ncbi:hypothetical protein RhiirC2_735629, partial [Rhizophagus irregularis]
GPIIEEVAKVLLQKGRLPLTRECLFVLIQHNLVYWTETREEYKELKMTFKKIVERRYLTPVRITDSKSAQDKASEAEQRELAKVTNFIPTKKQMAEVKANSRL